MLRQFSLVLLFCAGLLLSSCQKNSPLMTSETTATNQPLPDAEIVVVPPNHIQTAYYLCPPYVLTYKPLYSWWSVNYTQHAVYVRSAAPGGTWVYAGLSNKNLNGSFSLYKVLNNGNWWMYFTSPGGPPPSASLTPTNCACVKAFSVLCGPPPASGE
jgi:hypothetical protein